MYFNHMYIGPLTKSGASDRKDGKGVSFNSVGNLRFKYMSGGNISGALGDSMRKE